MATVLLSIATNTFHGTSCAPVSGTLTQRLVHPTASVLLTKNDPLVTLIQFESRAASRKNADALTHLKFENRLRAFRPHGL